MHGYGVSQSNKNWAYTMSFNVSEVPEWVLHYRNIWNETEWQLFENADNNTYNTTCFVPNLIPIRLRSHGLFLALFYLFLTSLIQQLLTAIEPWIAVYSSKCSLYKKKQLNASTNPFYLFSDVSSVTTLIIKELLLD